METESGRLVRRELDALVGRLLAPAVDGFTELGVSRMTARTRASSLDVRRVIEKAGFRQEGVLRSYFKDGEDAILFGMLKTECRW